MNENPKKPRKKLKKADRAVGIRRSKAEISSHRRQVAELSLTSTPMFQIAERIGVSIATVYADFKAVLTEWQEKSIESMDKIKSMELKKLERIEHESWLAWVRSITGNEIQEPGDPRFLKMVLDCMNQRAKILGLHEYSDQVNEIQMANLQVNIYDSGELDRIDRTVRHSEIKKISARITDGIGNGSNGGILSPARTPDKTE